jgi:hypothetical protein
LNVTNIVDLYLDKKLLFNFNNNLINLNTNQLNNPLHCPLTKNSNENLICTICLNTDFDNIDNIIFTEYLINNIIQTECNHYFHAICLFNWINRKKNTCPLCRMELIYNFKLI